MNRPKAIILLGIILLLTGCTDFFMICSLNPFYVGKNIALKPEMEGRWSALPLKMKKVTDKEESPDVWNQMDTTAVWKIERVINKETRKTKQGKDSVVFSPVDYYSVKLLSNQSDSLVYKFKMVLFTVNQRLYADFMSVENSGLEKSRFAMESYFKVHTLARIDLSGEQCKISWLGAGYMKDMIEKKRVRVSYRWVSGAGRLLLTGSSEQLTGMIERYAGETRFVDWEKQQAMLKLNRIK
ncbi:MAG: hypothetical protein M0Q53_01245 [Prolixibacteraceae bacterium]|jgi:hypothetical protein|nr:hypothetical protein [Prolixibacteraceae bacterium]